MCRNYSQRPSDIIGMKHQDVALDFDLAMSVVHRAEVESRAQFNFDNDNPYGAIVTALLG